MPSKDWQLQEVGVVEAPLGQSSTNFDKSTKLHLATEPPISCSCCWWFGLLIYAIKLPLSLQYCSGSFF